MPTTPDVLTGRSSAPKATNAAKPFIKWAGGKTQLLAQFAERYPSELIQGKITRYVEPFLGGGAVFLDIAQRYPIEEAILHDINEELILVYRVVQPRAASTD